MCLRPMQGLTSSTSGSDETQDASCVTPYPLRDDPKQLQGPVSFPILCLLLPIRTSPTLSSELLLPAMQPSAPRSGE
jgi:hypothetical protein